MRCAPSKHTQRSPYSIVFNRRNANSFGLAISAFSDLSGGAHRLFVVVTQNCMVQGGCLMVCGTILVYGMASKRVLFAQRYKALLCRPIGEVILSNNSRIDAISRRKRLFYDELHFIDFMVGFCIMNE